MSMYGIILVGGNSTRFGKEKLLTKLNGKPLLEYPLEVMTSDGIFDEVFLVGPIQRRSIAEEYGIGFLEDSLSIGPIGGIIEALRSLKQKIFVTGGDMPLINSKEILSLLAHHNGHIATVPRWPNGYLEPLFSVYTPRILHALLWEVSRGGSISDALRRVRTNFVPVSEISEDPERTFFNVNHPEDLVKAEALMRGWE